MEMTKKKTVLLAIGLLVSLFVFKGHCGQVKDKEANYIVFPEPFFFSNADRVERFLSNSVLTGTGSCVDKNKHCGDWAKRGECKKNPAYMLPNCVLSCNQCTVGTKR